MNSFIWTRHTYESNHFICKVVDRSSSAEALMKLVQTDCKLLGLMPLIVFRSFLYISIGILARTLKFLCFPSVRWFSAIFHLQTECFCSLFFYCSVFCLYGHWKNKLLCWLWKRAQNIKSIEKCRNFERPTIASRMASFQLCKNGNVANAQKRFFIIF